MFSCSKCGKHTEQGKMNLRDEFLCLTCFGQEGETLAYDIIEVTDKEVLRKSPFGDLEQEVQRGEVIHFAYRLFGNELHPRTYRLIDNYIKQGMTYLGILRTLQHFYLVRKGDISKANNSIGIVPHAYDFAQKFFEKENTHRHLLYLRNFDAIKQNHTVTEVQVTNTAKTRSIDMTEL